MDGENGPDHFVSWHREDDPCGGRGQGLFTDLDGRGGLARTARRRAHHGVLRALVRRDSGVCDMDGAGFKLTDYDKQVRLELAEEETFLR